MDLHYSQTVYRAIILSFSFTTLWIYTILKHCQSAANEHARFTTLWIYTILKRCQRCNHRSNRFTTLWIYTILKRQPYGLQRRKVSLPYGFTLFSNALLPCI